MNSPRRIAALVAFSLFLLLSLSGHAKGKPRNSYPNELQGFKLYAKYLAPLRPLVSDQAAVIRVMGPDERLELDNWTMWALYTTKGGPVYNSTLGPLAEINVKPKGRVSMLGVKFPSSFTHSYGNVSEIDISFDVYGDRFGLEYWLHEEDSKWGKKGDLYQIVYGPNR